MTPNRCPYCVVNSTAAIATERLTAETVATVESTPIRRSAMAKAMMMGVAVISPSCASLIVINHSVEPRSRSYRAPAFVNLSSDKREPAGVS